MTFTYCPHCSNKLIPKDLGDEKNVPYCEKCEHPWFEVVYPCVICLVLDGHGKVALIQQSYGLSRYVCVAGYIQPNESAKQAAIREIKEEIGLDAYKIIPLSTYPLAKKNQINLFIFLKK